MSVYVIVAADNDTHPAPHTELGALQAIAEALGVTSDALAAVSVPLVGEWNGEQEHSRAIRINPRATVEDWRDTYALAYSLRVRLGQEAVLVLARRNSDVTEDNMRKVFENVERVGIALPGQIEAMREDMSTTTQTEGEPIIPGVQNGSRWVAVSNDLGDYLMALV